jgi:hypothetical protein
MSPTVGHLAATSASHPPGKHPCTVALPTHPTPMRPAGESIASTPRRYGQCGTQGVARTNGGRPATRNPAPARPAPRGEAARLAGRVLGAISRLKARPARMFHVKRVRDSQRNEAAGHSRSLLHRHAVTARTRKGPDGKRERTEQEIHSQGPCWPSIATAVEHRAPTGDAYTPTETTTFDEARTGRRHRHVAARTIGLSRPPKQPRALELIQQERLPESRSRSPGPTRPSPPTF